MLKSCELAPLKSQTHASTVAYPFINWALMLSHVSSSRPLSASSVEKVSVNLGCVEGLAVWPVAAPVSGEGSICAALVESPVLFPVCLLLWIMGGFPGGLVSKEPSYSAGGLGLIPGSGSSPGEGNEECTCWAKGVWRNEWRAAG